MKSVIISISLVLITVMGSMAWVIYKTSEAVVEIVEIRSKLNNCLPTGMKRIKTWYQPMTIGKSVIVIPMHQQEIEFQCENGSYWRLE
ncbi:TPA: hypothetical protein QIF01_003347 [Serratia marcescens]|nr:hypothetical protein [Serratia marcescens]